MPLSERYAADPRARRRATSRVAATALSQSASPLRFRALGRFDPAGGRVRSNSSSSSAEHGQNLGARISLGLRQRRQPGGEQRDEFSPHGFAFENRQRARAAQDFLPRCEAPEVCVVLAVQRQPARAQRRDGIERGARRRRLEIDARGAPAPVVDGRGARLRRRQDRVRPMRSPIGRVESARMRLVLGRRGHLRPHDDAKRASPPTGCFGRLLESLPLVVLKSLGRRWRRRGQAFAPGQRQFARRQQPLKAFGVVLGAGFAQFLGVGAQHRAFVASRRQTQNGPAVHGFTTSFARNRRAPCRTALVVRRRRAVADRAEPARNRRAGS